MTKIFVFCWLLTAIVVLTSGSINDHAQPTPLEITYPAYFGNRINIPETNPTTVEGVELGRRLFYESTLSVTNSISCATCHKQELAFTDGEQFSLGAHGKRQPRNTMSLANLMWVRQFFWDGRVKGLEKQAETPLTAEDEMGQAMDLTLEKLRKKGSYAAYFEKAFGSPVITADHVMMAIAQFERTLVSDQSKYDQYLQGNYDLKPAEKNGIELFFTNPDPVKLIRGAGCSNCHGGPKTYTELFQNNGLDSVGSTADRETITGLPVDDGRFRVVTLRNIALTAPYMHDGRFKTLEAVMDHYSEHIRQSPTLSPFLKTNSNMAGAASLRLTTKEKSDIIAFLQTLTDSTFITNTRFSNPFN